MGSRFTLSSPTRPRRAAKQACRSTVGVARPCAPTPAVDRCPPPPARRRVAALPRSASSPPRRHRSELWRSLAPAAPSRRRSARRRPLPRRWSVSRPCPVRRRLAGRRRIVPASTSRGPAGLGGRTGIDIATSCRAKPRSIRRRSAQRSMFRLPSRRLPRPASLSPRARRRSPAVVAAARVGGRSSGSSADRGGSSLRSPAARCKGDGRLGERQARPLPRASAALPGERCARALLRARVARGVLPGRRAAPARGEGRTGGCAGRGLRPAVRARLPHLRRRASRRQAAGARALRRRQALPQTAASARPQAPSGCAGRRSPPTSGRWPEAG